MKYAIKIMLAADDWIYVSEPTGTMFEVRPLLFDTLDAAREHSKIWMKKGYEDGVKVVEFIDSDLDQTENTDYETN